MHKFLITLICLMAVMNLSAQYKDLYEKKEFISGTDTLRYRMLYPVNYTADKKYPLVVFLHGSGERGNDNEAQLTHGGKLFADSAVRQQFPAIVVFPQCSREDFWARLGRDPNKKDSLGQFTFQSEQPVGKSLGLVSNLID